MDERVVVTTRHSLHAVAERLLAGPRYLAQMRATIRALGTVPVETLPDEACDTLLTAFRDRFS